MPRYSHSDLSFDLSAIMASAWARARHQVKVIASLGHATTLRREFADALHQVWNIARQQRGIARWQAEQKANAGADAARRAALPVRTCQIEDAETVLMLAEHNDTNLGHVLVAAARARLSTVQHAA